VKSVEGNGCEETTAWEKDTITATGTDYLGSAKLSRNCRIRDEGEMVAKRKLTERV
jgi:hypothetical protein